MDLKLLIVDIEALGLVAGRDSVTEVAALQVNLLSGGGYTYATTQARRWKLRVPIGAEDNRGSAFAPFDAEAWNAVDCVSRDSFRAEFTELAAGRIWAGQNPQFDFGFLAPELPYLSLSEHRLFDVSMLARKLQVAGILKSVSQASLAKHFDLGEQSHDALGDVLQCARILEKLWGLQ